ncbi:hypothetical protein ACJVC5_00715 [Peredibacter sp. HCB2-198]|uniref:hypothetical protein n=1 Tax=Peredibacter sp. HCB2-198 TaxID=3383025 RepID=UPI0038B6A237
MLNLIYHFQTSQNQDEEFKPASYHVVYFFDDQGFIERSMLQELSKSVPNADHQALTFLNLDDLKDFALRVSQELNAPDVQLISVQDYNIGLDGAKDLASFQSIFQKYGEKIINEAAQKRKGLFGKLFS